MADQQGNRTTAKAPGRSRTATQVARNAQHAEEAASVPETAYRPTGSKPYPSIMYATAAYDIEDIEWEPREDDCGGVHLHFFVGGLHDMDANSNFTHFTEMDVVAKDEREALQRAKTKFDRRHYRVSRITTHEPKGDQH